MKILSKSLNKKISTPVGIIVIVLAAILCGGVLVWQGWWLIKQEAKEQVIVHPRQPMEALEKGCVELPIEELKEGKNTIDGVTVEKIRLNKKLPEGVEIKILYPKESLIEGEDESVWPFYRVYIFQEDRIVGSQITDALPKYFTFDYKNYTYILISYPNTGTAGPFLTHDVYVFDKVNNSLVPVDFGMGTDYPMFYSRDHFTVIGYENYLYLISPLYAGLAGTLPRTRSGEVYVIYDDRAASILKIGHEFLQKGREIAEFPLFYSLIAKDKKLYLKVNGSYCFSPLDCGAFGCTVLSCVNEYYEIQGDKLAKSNSEFRNQYLKEAKTHDEIMKEEEWAEDAPIENDWLSPLLNRTLNLVFAGEEQKAWQIFNEDFAMFSTKYPLSEQEKLDPQKIREDIQEKLTNQ